MAPTILSSLFDEMEVDQNTEVLSANLKSSFDERKRKQKIENEFINAKVEEFKDRGEMIDWDYIAQLIDKPSKDVKNRYHAVVKPEVSYFSDPFSKDEKENLMNRVLEVWNHGRVLNFYDLSIEFRRSENFLKTYVYDVLDESIVVID
jgi:hypothetical protein